MILVHPCGNPHPALVLDACGVAAFLSDVHAGWPLPYVAEAGVLLERLSTLAELDGHTHLAVTDQEITYPLRGHDAWGLLGLALLGGPAAVVSSLRCAADGAPSDVARHRFQGVVMHELLHTFGLDHCANKDCIMQDARGKLSTLERWSGLCDDCIAQLT